MPRGRPRKSGASVESTPAKKRAASPTAQTTPLRQSKRVKTVSVTPKKSGHFAADSELSELASSSGGEASGYEDEDASASEISSPGESESEEAEDSTEDDERPQKRRSAVKNKKAAHVKGSTPTKNGAPKAGGKELWREGVQVEGEGEVFIKLPKARPAGKTPYTEDTIHPNTLLFLADLKANNQRTWLKAHDLDFRQSEKDWYSFVDALTPKLAEHDETIPELPHKDLIFRIYRDVRFSKDPTPYKPHFSAVWSRTGRKGPYAGYYVQIGPKNSSFVGGGLWCPERDPLEALRRDVDRRPQRLKGVLRDTRIRREFLGGVRDGDAQCVQAFCKMNKDNALKVRPANYGKDHKEIALLRLRNYTMGRKVKDEEVLGPKGLDNIAGLLGTLTPFISYLNNVVMPDDAEEDSDDDGEEDEDAVDSDGTSLPGEEEVDGEDEDMDEGSPDVEVVPTHGT